MWVTKDKYAVVKKIGDKYRLTVTPHSNGKSTKSDEYTFKDTPPTAEDRLFQSISRSKRMIFEYASCNDWDWFVTLTLDPLKYDRFNLAKWHKDFIKWLNNYSSRKVGDKVKFLLVPEQHADGAWHMHGLLKGLPISFLQLFVQADNVPQRLIDNGYYNWSDYQKKFGFCSIDEIRNQEAVAKYITKYITKDVSKLNKEVNAHLYYCSRGLHKALVLHQDFVTVDGICFDYYNDFCGIKTFDTLDECMSCFV